MSNILSDFFNKIVSFLSKKLIVITSFILVTCRVNELIFSKFDGVFALIFCAISIILSVVFYIIVLKDMEKQEYINNKNEAIKELNKIATELETEIKNNNINECKKTLMVRDTIKLSGDFVITKSFLNLEIKLTLKDKDGTIIDDIILKDREP